MTSQRPHIPPVGGDPSPAAAIQDFHRSENAIGWTLRGCPISYPCSSETTALVFPSGNNILVVDRLDPGAPDNAVILSPQAQVLVRVENPHKSIGAIAFIDCYLADESLALVIAHRDRQFWCKTNEAGICTAINEWR